MAPAHKGKAGVLMLLGTTGVRVYAFRNHRLLFLPPPMGEG